MDTLREVLKEVQSGTTCFKPASGDEAGVREFQVIAKILVYAHEERLVEECLLHKDSETAQGGYDAVYVGGGLSYKGEMFLAEGKGGATDEELKELVQLRPNLYGVGVDLKELWKRWKQRRKE